MKKKVLKITALTPMQEGMLFHSLYNRDGENYHEQFCFYIAGKFNPARLKEAWQEVVNRHEVFRSDFRWKEAKEPVQIILESKEAEIHEVDFTGHPDEKVKDELEELKKSERKHKFDFEAGRLNRLLLVKLSEEKYFVCWTYHHILLDGWSVGLVIKDFLQIYASLISGTPLPLTPKGQFSDYLAWLKVQDRSAGLKFWEEYLNALAKPTYLPPDGKKAGVIKHGVVKRLVFDALTTKKLLSFCQDNNLTVNTFMETAWGLILQKHTGEQTSCFGMTVSGRPEGLKNIESAVGVFINTLPVVVSGKAHYPVKQLLKKVGEELLRVSEYGYISLPEIKAVSRINPTEDLFGSIVIFQNFPVSANLAHNYLDFELSFDSIFELTNYDLMLTITSGETLNVEFAYNSDLYSAERIENLKTELNTLVLEILASPQKLIRDLSIFAGLEGIFTKSDTPKAKMAQKPEGGYVKPRSAKEEALAAIWAEVLNVRVGIDDNFFELGGHSLKAIQLVARINRVMGLDIKLNDIFEKQTIRRLVESVENTGCKSVIKLNQTVSENNYFCIHGGGGSVAVFKELADRLTGYNFYGIQAKGLGPGEVLPKSAAEMVSDYLAEIRSVQPAGPYRIIGYSFGSYIAYELVAALESKGEIVERLIILDTPPFNPTESVDAEAGLKLMAVEMVEGLGMEIPGSAEKTADEILQFIYQHELYRHYAPFKDIAYDEVYRIKEVITNNMRISHELNTKSSLAGIKAGIHFIKASLSKNASSWQKWTAKAELTHTIEGDHATILRMPGVQKLAELLDEIGK